MGRTNRSYGNIPSAYSGKGLISRTWLTASHLCLARGFSGELPSEEGKYHWNILLIILGGSFKTFKPQIITRWVAILPMLIFKTESASSDSFLDVKFKIYVSWFPLREIQGYGTNSCPWSHPQGAFLMTWTARGFCCSSINRILIN